MTDSTTVGADTPAGRLVVERARLQGRAIGRPAAHTTIRARDPTRHALLVPVLLVLAGCGFATARLTSAPVHEPAARVCSETCGAAATATTPRPPQAGREAEKP
jgi:hypothetical protein